MFIHRVSSSSRGHDDFFSSEIDSFADASIASICGILDVRDIRGCIGTSEHVHGTTHVDQDCFVRWVSPSYHEHDHLCSAEIDSFSNVLI